MQKGRFRHTIKKKKNQEVYDLLNEFGVNAYVENLGSALSIACMTQNWEIAKYCIQNGADVNVLDSEKGTAVIDASKFGNLEIVRLLAKAGADFNVANKFDKRAIAIAIESQSSNLELIKFLLEQGANPFLEEQYMKDDPRRTAYTAYEYAVQEIGSPELVSLLDKYKLPNK